MFTYRLHLIKHRGAVEIGVLHGRDRTGEIRYWPTRAGARTAAVEYAKRLAEADRRTFHEGLFCRVDVIEGAVQEAA